MSIQFRTLKITLTGGATFDPLSATQLNVRTALVQLEPGATGSTASIRHEDDTDAFPVSKGVGLTLGMSGHWDQKNSESFDLASYEVNGTAGDDVYVLYEAIAVP